MASRPNIKPKKLIICCDGTWANSENGWVKDRMFENGHLQNPSNVTHFARALLPSDDEGVQQISYYQAGIGSNFVSWTDHLVAGMTGAGMSENIREAYSFLTNNYVPGDSIFVLGFSRGAFTARSIAGMIGGIGLLTKDGLSDFYNIFSDYENAGLALYKPKLPSKLPSFTLPVGPDNPDVYLRHYRAGLQKLELTRIVHVVAVGVWDTVGALGIPVAPMLQRLLRRTSFQEYQFYDTKLGDHVENAFQALAIDEERFAFKPTLWEKPAGCKTNLKQVWFAGAHGNVGGGADEVDTSPADISLAWMMSSFSPWLSFDNKYLSSHVRANRAKYYPVAPQTSKFAQVPPPRYGCGPLYNSSSLYWTVLGPTVRTPGMYHEVASFTGKELPSMLENTNEFVHASVRARIKFDGPGIDARTPYAPSGLKHWALQVVEAVPGEAPQRNDSATDHNTKAVEWQWVYEGKDKKAKSVVLPEDELGEMEKELMKMVDPAAETDLFGA